MFMYSDTTFHIVFEFIAAWCTLSKRTHKHKYMHSSFQKQSETNAALAKEHAAQIEKTTSLESQLISLQSANDDLKFEVDTLQTQMDKKADDHSHVLQETTEILQRTSDENEALNRALVCVS